MEAVFRVSGEILIVYMKGDVDHHSASYLRQSIDRTMKEFDCRDVVLDFSGVGFMDSAGIGVVLGRYKKLARSGGRVCVSGCSEYIDRILDMAGVFSLVDKARDSVGAEERMRTMRPDESMNMEG